MQTVPEDDELSFSNADNTLVAAAKDPKEAQTRTVGAKGISRQVRAKQKKKEKKNKRKKMSDASNKDNVDDHGPPYGELARLLGLWLGVEVTPERLATMTADRLAIIRFLMRPPDNMTNTTAEAPLATTRILVRPNVPGPGNVPEPVAHLLHDYSERGAHPGGDGSTSGDGDTISSPSSESTLSPFNANSSSAPSHEAGGSAISNPSSETTIDGNGNSNGSSNTPSGETGQDVNVDHQTTVSDLSTAQVFSRFESGADGAPDAPAMPLRQAPSRSSGSCESDGAKSSTLPGANEDVLAGQNPMGKEKKYCCAIL